MTKYLLEVELEDDACLSCPCFNNDKFCMDKLYCQADDNVAIPDSFKRPADCPLQIVQEKNCSTCKQGGGCKTIASCDGNYSLWEKKK